MNADQLKRAKDTLWAEVNRNIARTDDDKPGFVIDEHNLPVCRELCHHMVGGPTQWLVPGAGIGLAGPVGTFKTEMMHAYSRTLIRGGGQGFKNESMLLIEKMHSRSSKDERENGGPKIILRYGNMDRDLCLHDLGEEPQGQHFGVPCDVGGEIISLRYVLWKRSGFLTHFTTNLVDEDALRGKYDERTVSRLLEMARWMPLSGPDRRPMAKPVVRRNVELFQPEPPMPTDDEIARNKAASQVWIERINQRVTEAKAELPTRPKLSDHLAHLRTGDPVSAMLIDDRVKFGATIIEMGDEQLAALREQTASEYTEDQAAPFLKMIDEEIAARQEHREEETAHTL